MLSEKTLLLNRSEVADSVLSLQDLRIDSFELHRCMLHMFSLENQVYSIDLSDIIAFEDIVSFVYVNLLYFLPMINVITYFTEVKNV